MKGKITHSEVPETGGFEMIKFLDVKWKITLYKVPETDIFGQVEFLDMKWKISLFMHYKVLETGGFEQV